MPAPHRLEANVVGSSNISLATSQQGKIRKKGVDSSSLLLETRRLDDRHIAAEYETKGCVFKLDVLKNEAWEREYSGRSGRDAAKPQVKDTVAYASRSLVIISAERAEC